MSSTKEPGSLASAGGETAGNTAQRFRPHGIDFTTFQPPKHFLWQLDGKVATITLNRPERKNPLTFESYAELRDTFRNLDVRGRREGRRDHRRRRQLLLGRRRARDHRAAGRDAAQRRHAGPARVHAHDRRPGEGDARLPAADHLRGRRRLRRRRRDHRDGLGPALRHRRAARSRSCSSASVSPAPTWARATSCRASSARAARPNCSTPGARWTAPKPSAGASTTSCARRRSSRPKRMRWRSRSPPGPTFAHAMTKRCIHQEWSMGIDEAIEAEAQAQAICMQTKDYERAYKAFVAKQRPVFGGD